MLRLQPARRAARCLYEALGVPRNATADDIKSAFRERAKETHPDTSDGAAAKDFQDMVEAYRVLGDPKRRAAYDQEVGMRAAGPGPGGQWPRGYAENCSEEFRANLYGYKMGGRARGFPGSERASPEAEAVVQSVWAERAAIVSVLAAGMWFFLAPRSKKEDYKDPDPYPSRRVEPSAALRATALGGLPGTGPGAGAPGAVAAAAAAMAPSASADAVGAASSSSNEALGPEERRMKIQAEREALGDEVVRAYYNPFANTWHRLPEGYEPPGSMDLTAWHKKRTDPVEWSRLFAEGKLSEIIPRGGLKVRFRPKWDTYEPMLVKDPYTGKTVQVTTKLLPRSPREACEVEF